jgi:ABC-type Fe3+/spermidine/putrescine transport system ATPase subunit
VLEVRGLSKVFHMRAANVAALRSVDLQVARGEFFVLLGPSGCGKTTMLRLIAGLERPDEGTIRIDGETVCAGRSRPSRNGGFVPPEQRPIAMVFQSYAVWPHMNVHENVAFPLREGVRRLPPDQVKTRVAEVLELLALSDMAGRPVTTLSGGQQQRVALARAVALRPKVLLMDEPLSNLDFTLQARLRTELKELIRSLQLTTVYVTHNQMEAMEMGDRIAVMERGRIVQAGAPRDIYRFPDDEFVARFIGEMGLVPATVAGEQDGYLLLETAAGRMRARPPRNGGAARGGACFLGVRPEDVTLAPGEGGAAGAGDNVFEGEIVRGRFIGEATVYTARVGSADLAFRSHHGAALAHGTRVRLAAPADRCITVMPARGDAAAYARDDFIEAVDVGVGLGGGAR